MAANFEIVCPCCESTIVVDRLSGEVLLHKAKKVRTGGTFEDMVARLESSKDEVAKRFDKELESQKDRKRILEEKFREAMARVDPNEKPPVNPLDLD